MKFPADEEDEGCEISNNAALPHCLTTQSGASRSVAPARERSEARFLDARKSGSVNWYLSMKRYEGRVRWVCSLQVGFGGVRWVVGKVRVKVGWRPVGCCKEVVYVRGWGFGGSLDEEEGERSG